MHHGYIPEQTNKAKDAELKRRNEKLAPRGSIIDEAEGVKLERSFKWKDIINLVNEDE